MDDLRSVLNCNICQPPWAGYCVGHDSGSVYRNVVSLPCTSSDMYRLTLLISLMYIVIGFQMKIPFILFSCECIAFIISQSSEHNLLHIKI